jgi:hypothetical protein
MNQENIAPPGASDTTAETVSLNVQNVTASTSSDSETQSTEAQSTVQSEPQSITITEASTSGRTEDQPSETGFHEQASPEVTAAGTPITAASTSKTTRDTSAHHDLLKSTNAASTGNKNVKTFKSLFSPDFPRQPSTGKFKTAAAASPASTSDSADKPSENEKGQHQRKMRPAELAQLGLSASTSHVGTFGDASKNMHYTIASIENYNAPILKSAQFEDEEEASTGPRQNKDSKKRKTRDNQDSEDGASTSSFKKNKSKKFKPTKKSILAMTPDESSEDEAPKEKKSSTSSDKKKGRKGRGDMGSTELEKARAMQRGRDDRFKSTRQENSLAKKIDANFNKMLKGSKALPFKGIAETGNEKLAKIIDLQCSVSTAAKDLGLSGVTKMKKDLKKWMDWVTDTDSHVKLIESMADFAEEEVDLKQFEDEAPNKPTKKGASTRKSKSKKEQDEDEDEDEAPTKPTKKGASTRKSKIKIKKEPSDQGHVDVDEDMDEDIDHGSDEDIDQESDEKSDEEEIEFNRAEIKKVLKMRIDKAEGRKR